MSHAAPSSHKPHDQTESCPYCGHDITHDELVEIQDRIAKEQQALWDAKEKKLRAQHLHDTSELHKKLAAKDEATKTAIEAAEKKHVEALAAKDKALTEQLQIARKAEREATEQKLRDDRKALEAERKKLTVEKEARDKAHQEELARQRKVLEADADKKLRAQSAASDKRTDQLTKTVEDLKRQLEKKSNDELGDGAEVILYDDLREAFPDDIITRVEKGVAGADIKHQIYHNGHPVGKKIVYDSKNRKDYKHSYAEQLRKDQLAEKADEAILATRRFPSGDKELAHDNGVWLVNPARAVIFAKVLRESLIRLSIMKTSEQDKQQKQAALYAFMTSQRCDNLFTRVADEVSALRELDVKEKGMQENFRKKRAKFVGEVEKAVFGELQYELNKILGV